MRNYFGTALTFDFYRKKKSEFGKIEGSRFRTVYIKANS